MWYVDCQPYNIAQKWRFDNRMLDLFLRKCYLMISSSYNGRYSSVKARKKMEMNMLKIIRKVYMKKKALRYFSNRREGY